MVTLVRSTTRVTAVNDTVKSNEGKVVRCRFARCSIRAA